MSLKYAVKKTVFGFDETKTDRYLARPVLTGTVEFEELCEQVTLVGMAPRGVVNLVLAGLIDATVLNVKNGMSVKLGELGTLRPSFSTRSQDSAEDVGTDNVRRRKFIFTPGKLLRNVIMNVSITRYNSVAQEDTTSTGNGNGGGNTPGGSDDGNFE